jgi:hypothetical protein
MSEVKKFENFIKQLDNRNDNIVELIPVDKKSVTTVQQGVSLISNRQTSSLKGLENNPVNRSEHLLTEPGRLAPVIIIAATIVAIIFTILVFILNDSNSNTINTTIHVKQPSAKVIDVNVESIAKSAKFAKIPVLVYSPVPLSAEEIRLRNQPAPPPEDLLEYHKKIVERNKENIHMKFDS